jgi:hypothetical protein
MRTLIPSIALVLALACEQDHECMGAATRDCGGCTFSACRNGVWGPCLGVGAACDSGPLPARDAGLPGDAGTDAATDITPCTHTICGGGPCTLLADERVHAAMSNNDTGGIGLDETGAPYLHLELTLGAYSSLARRRGPGSWAVSMLPGSSTTGAVAVGRPAPVALVTYDGAFGSSLWHLDDRGAATVTAVVPTDQLFESGNLWWDAAGTLHMLAMGGTGRGRTRGPLYLTYDTTFASPIELGAGTPARDGRLALDDAGVAWVAWNEAGEGSAPAAVHVWRADLRTDEIAGHAAAIVQGTSGAIGLALRGTPEGTQPVVLVTDLPSAQLAVLVRGAAGTWTRTDLVGPSGPSACPVACTVDGQSAALVRLGDDIRVVMGASFRDPDNALHTLLLVMPIAAPTRTEVVLDRSGQWTYGVRAIADACGTIHVAHEQSATGSAGEIRYVQLGGP